MMNLDDTFGIDDAALVLRVHKDTAGDLARNGMIPGAKVGKEWVFVRSELMTWLKEETVRQTDERRIEVESKQSIHQFSEITEGGRFTPPPLDELER